MLAANTTMLYSASVPISEHLFAKFISNSKTKLMKSSIEMKLEQVGPRSNGLFTQGNCTFSHKF